MMKPHYHSGSDSGEAQSSKEEPPPRVGVRVVCQSRCPPRLCYQDDHMTVVGKQAPQCLFADDIPPIRKSYADLEAHLGRLQQTLEGNNRLRIIRERKLII